MKISKFKKYVSWNLISLTGYFCAIIALVFYSMLVIASSGITVRADINDVFYRHIFNNIIVPYLDFYKYQVIFIALCIGISFFENKYNKNVENFGVRWFSNHEKLYTALFVTGLTLNLLPLYIFLAIIIYWLIHLT